MAREGSQTFLSFQNGLWLGIVPSQYGMIELVLSGTADKPNPDELVAVQAFMLHAGDSIARLRRKLRLPLLWRPIRIAPDNENRIGVQFQHRIFNRRELLFADEV